MKDQEAKRIREAMQEGRLDMDDPEVLEVSRRSEDLAAELQDLRGLQEELDREALESRQAIQSARSAQVQASDLKLLEAIPEIQPERSSSMGPLWATLAVLGLLLGGWFVYQELNREPTQASTLMGGAVVPELIQPVGAKGDGSRFEWTGPEVAGAWFVVHAADLDSGETFESPKITGFVWEPKEDLTGRRLQWRVVWFSGQEGERVSSENAETQG